MRFSSRGFFACLALLCCAAHSEAADRNSHWRVFKAEDGLVESFSSAVSATARGSVWTRHGDASRVSLFDGYHVVTIPSPGGGNNRLFETPGGQVWSLHAEGVQEFQNGRWVLHRIPELQAMYVTNVVRQVRPFSFVPVEQNRLWIAVDGALIEYNATTHSMNVLRRATNGTIGPYSEVVAARHGGAWLIGSAGVAKTDQIPRGTNNIQWKEYPLPPGEVVDLQRPLEDDLGGITCIGENTLADRRSIASFDGSAWTIHTLPNDNPRFAWRAAPGEFVVATANTLFNYDSTGKRPVSRDEVSAGLYFDAATDRKGILWIATSDGLYRRAPQSWQTVRETGGPGDTPIFALVEDDENGLWAAGLDQLYLLSDGKWSSHVFENGGGGAFQTIRALYRLPGRLLVIAGDDRSVQFDASRGQFDPLPPRLTSSRVLGATREGSLCVWTPGRPRGIGSLGLFDGKSVETFPGQASIPSGIDFQVCYASQNGDLWFGGSGGIVRFREGRWQTFTPAEHPIPDTTIAIIETSEGKIWCAGRDRIAEFAERVWSVAKSGFDGISSLHRARDGSIWVTSNSGIHRYVDRVWLANGPAEGLPGSGIYGIHETRQGQIWVGTTRGLSRYEPSVDSDFPQARLHRGVGGNIFTADSVVKLTFQGYDRWKHTTPDRLLFSHRLDEQEWSEFTSVNTVPFSDLAAGTHHFQVRAVDRNWNIGPPTLFEFVISVPWYNDSRILIILSAALLVTLFFAGLAFNRHLRLVKSYAEVEKIVALRTRQLEKANEELLHSQKMKALGTLAAGVAHDFNNILSIIKGSAQIIESNLSDAEKVRVRVGRIKTVVDQASALVKAMLGFSRPSEPELRPENLNPIVDETIKLLGDRFQRDVSVQFEPAEGLISVNASREQIQQMLLNLIFNAADAMEREGEIVLRTGETLEVPTGAVLAPAKAQHYAFVSVHDQGTGIEPEVLPRIFEPFFTTKAFSSRRGTGLGLSMVYEICRKSGYGLRVDSAVGKGSTFTIIFPGSGVPSTAQT